MPYVTEHIGERLYGEISVLFCIFLVPYIRYLVLHNHSYLHCFFTYRAQMETVPQIAPPKSHYDTVRWDIL